MPEPTTQNALPKLADVSLFDPATLIDPYAAYQTLRDLEPVHFVQASNVHVVTRYDLVREAIKDTKTFSSKYDSFLGAAQEMMFNAAPKAVQDQLLAINAQMELAPPTMLTLDEPEHTQYRSLVAELFTASRIKGAEATVQSVIDRTIASFAGQTSVDFMDAFAGPVPLIVIAERLGIPAEDRDFFELAATEAAGALRLSPLTPEQMLHRAQVALDLQRLLIRIVEDRRRNPQEDMISVLANSKLAGENRYLTHGECISVLNQFLVAGHETTTSTFGWGTLLLCRNPEVQEQIRGDAKRIRTFVEEALRLEAPVQGLPRLVTQDTELGGYPLVAGSMIMLRYGAANRDERQFAEPDELQIDRPKAGSQLAFGAGVHFCIGAPLARQELNLGFATLLEHISSIELDTSAPAPEAEPSFILRNLPKLQVKLAWR